jgi:hydroxyacylglutathione hydrolase
MPPIIPIPAFRDNYIWLIRRGSHAVVVDAGDAAPVIAYLEREALELSAIICTHHHNDHVGGNVALLERWSVRCSGRRTRRFRAARMRSAKAIASTFREST